MGLSSRAIVRRLRAWHLGEPLTRGKTIHTFTAPRADRLLLAFVKMGGETRPWAIAWKLGTGRAQFRFVPEPRFRQAVDEMVAELGPLLAGFLQHPEFTDRTPAEDVDDLGPLRQVWVPNGSHLDMLHHFAYAYAHRRPDSPHATELRLLGRTSLFAFLEASRPGQQLVMAADAVLRSAYDFPAEDARQAHLGFLLAWLEARGGRSHGLQAALEAEKLPVATALLPDLERDELEPLVSAHNEARRAGDSSAMEEAERRIGQLLRPELDRRLQLLESAIELIGADPRPVNRGVAELARESLKAQWWEYVNPERRAIARGQEPWVGSAETDFQPKGAAARYFRFEAAADRMVAALVHDDQELEAEAIATGRAFRGTVTAVRDEGTGRSTVPVMRLEDPTPGPLSLRRGDNVCFVGHPQRTARIRSIETTHGGGLEVELEITNRKRAAKDMPWPHSMAAHDERWIGHVLTIINTSFADMTDKKAMKVRSTEQAPGDWLLVGRRERDVADEVEVPAATEEVVVP